MRYHISAAVGLLATLPAFALAGTTILVNEDFGSSSGLSFYSYSPDGALNSSAGHLTITSAAANQRYATSTFTRTTLGIGDSITLGFKLTGSRNGPNWITDFNIGLYDSQGTYATDNSAASQAASRDDQGYLLGLRDDWASHYSGTFGRDYAPSLVYDSGQYMDNQTFTDGVFHQFEMTFTRSDTNKLLVSVSEDGIVFYTTSISAFNNVFTFDNIQFTNGSRASTILLDDITVAYTTTVPEPASLAVLALSSATILMRRLKR